MLRNTTILFCALLMPSLGQRADRDWTACGDKHRQTGLPMPTVRPRPLLHRSADDYRLAGAIVGGVIGASMLAVSEGIDSGAEAPRRAATFFFGIVAFIAPDN